MCYQCWATLCGWLRYADEMNLPAVVVVSRCTAVAAAALSTEGYADCTPLPDSQTGRCL